MIPPTDQPAKPPRTWRPMALWTAGILLVLGLASFCLTMWLAGRGHGNRAQVPELCPPFIDGPALLNVDGAGYVIGDIIQVRAATDRIAKGDVVLYDHRPMFGPSHGIAKVVGMPGEQFKMADLQKGASPQAATFARRGVRTNEDSFILGTDDYLLEANGTVRVANKALIGALVVKKLGHDDKAAKDIRGRVY